MKIGMIVSSISRNAGGIYDAVRYLARNLQHIPDRDIEVFGLEDAYTARDLAGWSGISTKVHRVTGPRSFGFSTSLYSSLDYASLDLLHSHGLWMYPSKASLLWATSKHKPHIISPHGMLDPWAVRNSHWKKRIVGWLYEDEHLHRAACLHALSDAERVAIRAYGLKNSVATVCNGVDLPDLDDILPKPEWDTFLPSGSKVLFFLGRVHPKKGLSGLLTAWAQTHQRGVPGAENWQLVIAGWEQGGHQAELERQARELGIEATVHFVGPLFNTAKASSLRRANAFVLPSFSEGLPMAVLEAWSYALPVVMTPECNLSVGFALGAAIQIHPDMESIARGLEILFTYSETERIEMGKKGRSLVETQFTWSKVGAEMMEVYKWVLGGGGRPDCVRSD